MPTFKILPDHHQFYLFDNEACPSYPEEITEADFQSRFKAIANLVAVYTDNDAEIEVAIECAASPPPIDKSAWAHIVEGPLNLPSGQIVIASPSSYIPECPRIAVWPGCYRARVATPIAALAGMPRYVVSLWPSDLSLVAVIKSERQYAA